MKQTNVLLCVAEEESLNEFAQKVSELSCRHTTKCVLAKFDGKLLLVYPYSTPSDIRNRMEWLENNESSMTVVTNL